MKSVATAGRQYPQAREAPGELSTVGPAEMREVVSQDAQQIVQLGWCWLHRCRIAAKAALRGADHQLSVPRHDEHRTAVARTLDIVIVRGGCGLQDDVRALHALQVRHRDRRRDQSR